PSGSITYDLYRWHRNHQRDAGHYLDESSVDDAGNPQLIHTHLEEDEEGPNGFRRDYMLRKAEDEGRNVSMLTSSFVEFLALYGHFAGGDFPSDEDDEDDGEDEDEDDSTNAVVVAEPSANGRLSSRHNFKQPASLGGSSTRIAKQPATSLSSKASVRKSFFLLLKSFIGSGVLFLPKAFYNGGLLFSCVIMLVSAIVSLYTMLLLIKCYEKVHCGYGEMGRRLYGKWMEKAVLLSIVVSQIGFACAGTIFVATNMRDLFNAVTDCNHRMPLSFWVVIQLIVLAPLCLIRHIKGLSSIALLADLFIVAGLIYVWWMDVSKISKLGIGYVRNFNPEDYSLFIGTAAYTFEGYALILPIVDAMQRPEKFPAVLSVVMAICTAVAVAMGGLSYSAFGDKTESIILLNMPSSTLMTLTVQLLYSLAMIFTLPLMMFPVIRILEQALFPRRSGKRNPAVKMQKNTFRMLLLVVVVVISIVGVEKLDRLIAIVGGFACIPIAFIYPPLFHLKSIARSNWERIRDAFLAFFGFVVCVYVT
ncbi:transmembrane amino acid transporter protein-domain-containing protein, partial [Coemansia spiralis]